MPSPSVSRLSYLGEQLQVLACSIVQDLAEEGRPVEGKLHLRIHAVADDHTVAAAVPSTLQATTRNLYVL